MAEVRWLAVAVAAALGAAALPSGHATASDSACADLPYEGRFHGNLVHGDSVAEIRLACDEPVVQPFTATRAGTLTRVQWYVRYDPACHGTPGCYSSGDGGAIRIDLHEAGRDRQPLGEALARSAVNGGLDSIFEAGGPGGGFPSWRLDRPVRLETGGRYAVVLRNLSCSGHVSTDGMLARWGDTPAPADAAGPYYGDDRPILRNGRREAQHLSLMALHQEDGTVLGPGTVWATGSSRAPIGGGFKARQVFRMGDAAREVDAVHLWAWRTSPEAGPLTVTLRGPQGELLGRTVLPASSFPLSASHEAAAPPRPWVRAALDPPVLLPRDVWLSVELEAQGCCYQTIPTHRSARWAARERWGEGQAEFSEDGGGTWRCARTRDPPGTTCGADLALGLAVSGVASGPHGLLRCRGPKAQG